MRCNCIVEERDEEEEFDTMAASDEDLNIGK
jgi:hypothetical protein